MAGVIIEMRAPNGWQQLGPTLSPNAQPGSISTIGADGQREVIMFGWHGEDGPGVWLSNAGVDVEVGVERAISSLELRKVADLTEEPFETIWRRPNAEVSLRFRYQP